MIDATVALEITIKMTQRIILPQLMLAARMVRAISVTARHTVVPSLLISTTCGRRQD